MKKSSNKPQGKSSNVKGQREQTSTAKLKEQQGSFKNSDGAGVGGKINSTGGSGSTIGRR